MAAQMKTFAERHLGGMSGPHPVKFSVDNIIETTFDVLWSPKKANQMRKMLILIMNYIVIDLQYIDLIIFSFTSKFVRTDTLAICKRLLKHSECQVLPPWFFFDSDVFRWNYMNRRSVWLKVLTRDRIYIALLRWNSVRGNVHLYNRTINWVDGVQLNVYMALAI